MENKNTSLVTNPSLISIITVTYNNYEDLLLTVDSVKNILDSEHIIINGGNCEKTAKFLHDFPGIFLSENDQGISDAFNKGIKLSNGSAIMFLNSGDILLDKTYPKRALSILENNLDIDFVHADEIYNDTHIGSYIKKPLRTKKQNNPSIGRGMPYRHQTMIIRKTLFKKIGLFNIKLITMDYEWICRWELTSGIAYYLEGEPVVQMDGSGVSARKEWKVVWEAIKIVRTHFPKDILTNLSLFKRILFFWGRELLNLLRLHNLLASFKRWKYKKHLIIVNEISKNKTKK